MALEEDIRHSESNAAAKRRATDMLRPAFRQAFAELLEIDESDIGEARDAIKAQMRSRRLREERTNATVWEIIKWAVGAALGGAGMWIVNHMNGGK